MSRYTGWRRLSGDTATRPDLLDLGKRLLGELETQRRLSGVQTLSRQVTTDDGSVVTARFIGDIPSIDVQAAPQGAPGMLVGPLFGLVTKPRKFGTGVVYSGGIATGNVGTSQNAYGQDAHTVLVPVPNPQTPSQTDWKALFFDASYAVEGSGQYGRAFGAGLSAHGNVDWRDANEQAAITWVGAAARTWLTSIENITTTFARIESTRIYHNGREVLNHTPQYEGLDETIAGACLRRQGGRALLVYATRPGRARGGDTYAIRIYAVPLKPDVAAHPWLARVPPDFNPLHAPAFVPADPLNIVLLGEVEYPVIADSTGTSGYGLATLFFNQAGTQARGILVTSHTDTQDLGFIEVIADLADDLSEAVFTQVDHGAFHRAFTQTTTYTDVEPAVYQYRGVEEDIYSSSPEEANKVNDRTMVFNWVPTDTGPFPVAVDFQDDVPVYLWYVPETQSRTITYTSTWSSVETGTWVDGSGVIETSEVEAETTVETVTGGRLYAIDKDAVTWLDLDTDREYRIDYTSTATLSLASTGMSLSGSSSSLRDDSAPGNDGHASARDVIVWWADLRSRSISYSRVDVRQYRAITSDTTASGGPTADGTGYADPDSRTVTSDDLQGVLVEVDTRVIFYGAQVHQMTSSQGGIPPPSPSVDTTLFTITPRHVLNGGYATSQSDGAVVVVTQDQMLEDALNLHQQSADLEFVGGALPLIAYEPTSTANLAYPRYDTRWGAWIAHRGAWAYSMRDLDRADPAPLLFTHGIKDGDLVALTGDRLDVELFEPMWPLALCALPI